MSSVNHDCLSKFFSNRARRCFCRIRRSQNVTDFADRIFTLVNQRNTFFAARCISFVWWTLTWSRASHELNNVFPRVASLSFPELLLENRQHRPVKLLRLRHAHAMYLHANNVEARP